MYKSLYLFPLFVAYAVALPWHNDVKYSNAIKQSSPPGSLPGFIHVLEPCDDDESNCKSALPKIEALDNLPSTFLQVCRDGNNRNIVSYVANYEFRSKCRPYFIIVD